MSSLNKWCGIGNLGRDPEVRSMQNGDKVCNLSVATNDSWKDKNTGERKEKVEYHRVVIFGKVAEIAERYLSKGSKVYIEGALQTRKWTDQSGQDKYSTEVVLQGFGGKLIMLDGKGDNNGRSKGGGFDAPSGNPQGGDINDDIPW